MRNLIQRLMKWARRRHATQSKPSPAMIQKLAHQLEATYEVEYSCDDVLRLLDQFVEAFLRGEDVAQLWPLLQRHLDMCADCHEEFETLVRILRASAA